LPDQTTCCRLVERRGLPRHWGFMILSSGLSLFSLIVKILKPILKPSPSWRARGSTIVAVNIGMLIVFAVLGKVTGGARA